VGAPMLAQRGTPGPLRHPRTAGRM